MTQQVRARPSTRPPFWRDVHVLAILGQIIFVILVVLVAALLYSNVVTSMQRIGISGNLDFMQREAGFEIGIKPIVFEPSDSYWRAFQVGIVNTISVALVSIILASLLGLVVGIAQLSTNWLVARLAEMYVAIFRNVPVLLQIIFWDQAVFLKLPRVRNAIELPGPIYFSNRGLTMIGPQATATTTSWLFCILGGVMISIIVWYVLKGVQDRTGQQSPRFLIGTGIVLASAGLGWLVLTPQPLLINVPELRGLNFDGGLDLPRSYAALLFGLSVYTGAFIAENVRAGIQGIARGQYEAARAIGLKPGQQMRLVILPQALRIIIPPTTNQYLNLLKNSSLAIAIGYPDLYNIARTINNQTGQTVPIIGIIIASYLTISLVTSLLMNLYNRSIRLVER